MFGLFKSKIKLTWNVRKNEEEINFVNTVFDAVLKQPMNQWRYYEDHDAFAGLTYKHSRNRVYEVVLAGGAVFRIVYDYYLDEDNGEHFRYHYFIDNRELCASGSEQPLELPWLFKRIIQQLDEPRQQAVRHAVDRANATRDAQEKNARDTILRRL